MGRSKYFNTSISPIRVSGEPYLEQNGQEIIALKIPETSLDFSIVEEAPIDGNQYARQDGGWTVVSAGEEIENFSYNNVISSKVLIVPQNQQMAVHGELKVDGEIQVNGDIVILEA